MDYDVKLSENEYSKFFKLHKKWYQKTQQIEDLQQNGECNHTYLVNNMKDRGEDLSKWVIPIIDKYQYQKMYDIVNKTSSRETPITDIQ